MAAAAPSDKPAPAPKKDEIIRELLMAFSELDHDHTGHVSAQDLIELSKKRRKTPMSLEDAKLSIAMKDLNQDGTLSLSEWLHFYTTGTRLEDPSSDDHVLEFMYSWFDDDGNHAIDKDELRGALRALDCPASDEFVDKIMSDLVEHRPHMKGSDAADEGKAGGESKKVMLSLDEFKEAVRKGIKAAPDLVKEREAEIEKESYQTCTVA